MGILNDLINSQSCYLTPDAIIKIVKDIKNAIKSLHSFFIIHGNICPYSIFVIISGKVKTINSKIHFHSSLTNKNKSNHTLNQKTYRNGVAFISLL